MNKISADKIHNPVQTKVESDKNSPGMTILSIWLLAAEKTRRQDGREVAWPWGGGVIVAGLQKSRLRRAGEVCCSNFGVGAFSLPFFQSGRVPGISMLSWSRLKTQPAWSNNHQVKLINHFCRL
jgi:hypothetical protein